jgi:hypothetical protein
MELSGRLSSFPIAELLMWAKNDRRTGALVVRRTHREKRIYFVNGEVHACLSNQPADFYGQHLLLSGHLDQESLRQSIEQCRTSGKRLGTVLLEAELLNAAEVEKTLAAHLFEVVTDIFLWDHGLFFFQNEQPPVDEILMQPLDAMELTFEGTHWKDDYNRIRETLPHDDVVLAHDLELMSSVELKPRHRLIYDEITGRRTLIQVYKKVSGSYFRFLQAISELHQDGFLEIATMGLETPNPTMELPLRELLFEEAHREQHKTSRLFTSPLGAFQRYVPVWVRPPSQQDWDPLPASLKALYVRFNGCHRLEEILSDDDQEWRLQTELLMLQIKQEAIALLPAPSVEVDAEAEIRRGSPEERWWQEVMAKG